MEFQNLGPLEVMLDDVPLDLGEPQRRLVLALLLAHPGSVVSTDRLMDGIWNDHPPDSGRKIIQGYVSGLRGVLGGGNLIESSGPGYRLNVKPDDVDASVFESLVARGIAVVRTDPHGARSALTRALALWRGRPYEDLANFDTLTPEITRLEQIHVTAIEAKAEAEILSGDARAVTDELAGLTRRFPLRERVWSLRMLALYRTSRQADALRVYAEARTTLATEVGLEPSAEMRLLEQRILDQDPVLDTPAAFDPSVAPADIAKRNPYKGLRPFAEEDAKDFFGRAGLVRRLQEMLEARNQSRLVVLAGPSGSGKSSIVRAGLTPRLREAGWSLSTMYPGDTPRDSLESVSDGLEKEPKSLLIVDQFEESITLTTEAERDLFFDSLVEMATEPGGLWVLVTVRADFLDRLLTHHRLAELVEPGLLLVTPLEDHDVRDAIERPASRVGATVDPDVVAAMVSEVGTRASALPLLQYALTDLYDRCGDGPMTLEALEAAGGLSGALAKRADELFAGLDENERSTAQQLFLRLVTLTPEEEVLRRRVTSHSLAGLPDVESVLQTLGQHRLLTFNRDPDGQPTVEVAHEALLREWPRLSGWIEDARDSLRTMHQVAEAVDEWQFNDRADTYLLTGSRLARFDEWADNELALSHIEDEFLMASRNRHQQQQAQRRRRRTSILAGFASAAVIATILAVSAASSASSAEHHQALAISRELAASAISTLDEDPELSTLLAMQAIDVAPGDGALSASGVLALRTALQRNRLIARIPGNFAEAKFSPDGSTIFVASEEDRTVSALDSSTGSVLWTFADPIAADAIWALSAGLRLLILSVSPDGEMIAVSIPDVPDIDDLTPPVGAVDGHPARVVVLDAMSGAEIRTFTFDRCRLSTAQGRGFTADGKWLTIGTGTEDCWDDPDATWVNLYDTQTWREGPRIQVEEMLIETVSFNSDGSRVLVQDARNGAAELHSFPDLELINKLPPGYFLPTMGSGLQAVTESPEVARRLLLVDARSGNRIGLLDVDDFTTAPLSFSQDGSVVAIPTRTHDYVFDATNGRLLVDIGNTGTTRSIDIAADGVRMVTVNSAGIHVWDIATRASAQGTPLTLPGGEGMWLNPNVVVDGQTLAVIASVADGDTDLEEATMTLIVDPATGSTIDVVPGSSLQLADGRFVVASRSLGTDDRPVGPLVVLDRDSGQSVVLDDCVAPLGTLNDGHPVDCPGPFFSWYAYDHNHLVSSADGSYFAATSYARAGSTSTVRLWDTKSLEISSEFSVPPGQEVIAAGSTWLATVKNFDPTSAGISAYDLGGAKIADIPGPSPEAFPELVNTTSRNGSILFVADIDGVVLAIDTTSWEQAGRWKAHDAQIRGFAISPDGERFATTGQDDLVKVWDISGLVAERSIVGAPPLLDRVPVHFPSDAAWLSADELGVFSPDPVEYTKISLNVDELVAQATSRLTRSFAVDECALYQIERCPTLDEIQNR